MSFGKFMYYNLDFAWLWWDSNMSKLQLFLSNKRNYTNFEIRLTILDYYGKIWKIKIFHFARSTPEINVQYNSYNVYHKYNRAMIINSLARLVQDREAE